MVLIIGNEESNHLFLFSFLVLHEREYKAAVNCIIIRFYIFLSAINQGLLLHSAPCCHREKYLLAYLVVFRVIRTGLRQNTQHIKDTAAVAVLHLLRFTHGIMPGTSLLYGSYTVIIREPCLIDRIAFSLLGCFTKIKRFQFIADIARQRIAHFKEKIRFLATHRKKIETVGRLEAVSSSISSQACQPYFLPDKFPVKIQIVHNMFARLKRFVLSHTLSLHRHYAAQTQKSGQQKQSCSPLPFNNYIPYRCYGCCCCGYSGFSSFSCLHLAFVFSVHPVFAYPTVFLLRSSPESNQNWP